MVLWVEIEKNTLPVVECKCGQKMFFHDGTPWNYHRSPVLMRIEGKPVKTRAFVSHFVTCPNASEFSKKGG